MTAPELIQEIERAGGVLTLRGSRIRFEVPEDVASLVEVLRDHREEVFLLLRERDRVARCYVHGAKATWWSRVNGSWVCRRCHPDPFAAGVEAIDKSRPARMPEGVRLLVWAPAHPPVAVETFAVVNDVSQFIRTTLQQLESALKGDCLGAGNWPVRTLVERLEQVGVKVEVAK
jgi:hypothetical protein